MTYSKSFQIRWSEIDVNWHMRNTAFAELGTTTRVSFLSDNGFPPDAFQAQGFGPVVLREETQYRHEVRLGMTVTFTLEMSGVSLDGSHFEMHHDVLLEDGRRSALLRVEGSWLDLASRKLRVPPPALLQALLSLHKTDDFRELRSLIRRKT